MIVRILELWELLSQYSQQLHHGYVPSLLQADGLGYFGDWAHEFAVLPVRNQGVIHENKAMKGRFWLSFGV
jgi:hypothetical protein